jgi:hypothetical protein
LGAGAASIVTTSLRDCDLFRQKSGDPVLKGPLFPSSLLVI